MRFSREVTVLPRMHATALSNWISTVCHNTTKPSAMGYRVFAKATFKQIAIFHPDEHHLSANHHGHDFSYPLLHASKCIFCVRSATCCCHAESEGLVTTLSMLTPCLRMTYHLGTFSSLEEHAKTPTGRVDRYGHHAHEAVRLSCT